MASNPTQTQPSLQTTNWTGVGVSAPEPLHAPRHQRSQHSADRRRQREAHRLRRFIARENDAGPQKHFGGNALLDGTRGKKNSWIQSSIFNFCSMFVLVWVSILRVLLHRSSLASSNWITRMTCAVMSGRWASPPSSWPMEILLSAKCIPWEPYSKSVMPIQSILSTTYKSLVSDKSVTDNRILLTNTAIVINLTIGDLYIFIWIRKMGKTVAFAAVEGFLIGIPLT